MVWGHRHMASPYVRSSAWADDSSQSADTVSSAQSMYDGDSEGATSTSYTATGAPGEFLYPNPARGRLGAKVEHRRRVKPVRQKEQEVLGTLSMFDGGPQKVLADRYLEEHIALKRLHTSTDASPRPIPHDSRVHHKTNMGIPQPRFDVPQPRYRYRNQHRDDAARQRRFEQEMAQRLDSREPFQHLTTKVGRKLPWG